ncbi:MAG TPA: hypothetical protein VJA47_00725 [archaeon]|nr:hypothetical protein [archaeon]
MKGKVLFLVFAFSILASFVSANAYLESNFYFTMAPNSTECLYTTLPSDLGFLEDDNYTLKINSGFETNINFIQTRANKENAVKIPICFSSENRKEGDNAFYNITISSNKLRDYEFKGGICVSKVKDVDKADPDTEKNPCEVVNGLADLFWFDMYPLQIMAQPGQEETVYLNIWPSTDMELDINISTDAQINTDNLYFRLKRNENKPLEFKVKTPGSGQYYLNLTVRAVLNRKYCDLPFCKKTASAKISSGGVGFSPSKAGTWSFTVSPRFISVYDTKPLEYTVFVENNKEDSAFEISLDTPNGLTADVKDVTDFIKKGERKQYKFNVTIADPNTRSYTIDFVVKADVEKVLTAFLSLYEAGDDIKRSWDSIRQTVDDKTRAEVDDLVNKYLIDLKDNGFDVEQYNKIKTKIDEARGRQGTQPTQTTGQIPTAPKTGNVMDLIIIVLVPIIVVIIMIVLLFARKREV